MSSRGGKRTGAGRPPLLPTGPSAPHNIRLSPADEAQLRAIGDGSLTQGIARLLARYHTLIGLLERNLRTASSALRLAQELGAPTAGFESDVRDAITELETARSKYSFCEALATE